MEGTFPDGFFWGTATAAHQVEGGNVNNDWWEWEHRPGTVCVEPSGDACDQFHLYGDDVAMLAALGFDTYRFSVEWSRVEPEDGEFSGAALDHYARMCDVCLSHGVAPVVTFHHFTTPRWVAERGGWSDGETPDLFARFCERTAKRLAPDLAMACTINEPNIVATMGYLFGIFPPGARDPGSRRAVNDVFVAAHRRAYDAIKACRSDLPVGMTLSMADWQGVDGGDDELAVLRRDMEDVYLEAARGDDFLGVQCYSRIRVGPDGMLGPEPGRSITQMGYEYWPACVEATLRYAWEVTGNTPLVVTENGIGTSDDAERIAYVTEALEGVARCLDDGIDVRGYVYWSLLDNFEWVLGYGPTFGLVEVDRTSPFARRPKPSATWLGSLARSNRLPG